MFIYAELEQPLREEGEVIAPVFPDVAILRFVILILVAVGIHEFAKTYVLVKEEVGLADGNPVE